MGESPGLTGVCSLRSREPLLPGGVPPHVEQPAALLVGAAVPAGAGAPPVETHAAGVGAVLRVRRRGEGLPGSAAAEAAEGQRHARLRARRP